MADCCTQADYLVPETEMGRCKAAICFWNALFAVLLPAMLLTLPLRRREPTLEHPGWLR
jgi:hypothetical protein